MVIFHHCMLKHFVPGSVMCFEAMDGLLLATVHVYTPPSAPVTLRVWVYCAVTGSSNTVSVSPVTVTESLVQVTVVYRRSTSGNTGEDQMSHKGKVNNGNINIIRY